MPDPDQTPTPADSSATTLVANFRLPTFSSIDSSIWFRRAEVQFRLKRITSSSTKADHVLAAIPDTLFPQMSEWLDAQGDDALEYDELKQYLLQKFTLSPEKRVEALFSLSKQGLGDQRPSDALDDMRALARLPPDPAGRARNIDVLLALWLRRLPDPVRSNITEFSTYTDAFLKDRANALLDAHHATSRPSIPAAAVPTPDDVEQLPPDDGIDAVTSTRRPLNFFSSPRFKPPGTKAPPSKSSAPAARPKDFASKLCFYHTRFGHAARKCEAPCAWPKNSL